MQEKKADSKKTDTSLEKSDSELYWENDYRKKLLNRCQEIDAHFCACVIIAFDHFSKKQKSCIDFGELADWKKREHLDKLFTAYQESSYTYKLKDIYKSHSEKLDSYYKFVREEFKQSVTKEYKLNFGWEMYILYPFLFFNFLTHRESLDDTIRNRKNDRPIEIVSIEKLLYPRTTEPEEMYYRSKNIDNFENAKNELESLFKTDKNKNAQVLETFATSVLRHLKNDFEMLHQIFLVDDQLKIKSESIRRIELLTLMVNSLENTFDILYLFYSFALFSTLLIEFNTMKYGDADDSFEASSRTIDTAILLKNGCLATMMCIKSFNNPNLTDEQLESVIESKNKLQEKYIKKHAKLSKTGLIRLKQSLRSEYLFSQSLVADLTEHFSLGKLNAEMFTGLSEMNFYMKNLVNCYKDFKSYSENHKKLESLFRQSLYSFTQQDEEQ